MLRYHMAVITPDNRLRREIKRVTTATNSTAQFAQEFSELSGDNKANLVIYDARTSPPPADVLAALPKDASLTYVVDSDGLTHRISLLADPRVCSLLCHDEDFDGNEFIASATKVLRGDVFGLQKYFPWGVTTFSMVVRNYNQKSRALEIIKEYAQEAGVRGPVRDRIELVADELMMNALYHAPVDAQGKELYGHLSRKDLTAIDDVSPIQVQYGCSGRHFGISVRDAGGSLSRQKALEYLRRAERTTAEIENKPSGAGLGLVSVLRSVSKVVFNLDPGSSTEVIALFDLDSIARGKIGARSLHIFVAPPAEPEEADEVDEGSQADAPVPQLTSSGAGKWVALAVLLAVLTGLATAYVMHDKNAQATTSSAAPPLADPTVTVVPSPPDAVIKLNGTPIPAGKPSPLPQGTDSYVLSVEKKGYAPKEKKFNRANMTGPLEWHADLTPGPGL